MTRISYGKIRATFSFLTFPLGKTLMNIVSSRTPFRTEAPPSPTTTNLFLFAARQHDNITVEVKYITQGRGKGERELMSFMAAVVQSMTIDPRIPTMPGRSTSGFHRPGRHCTERKEPCGEMLGESHEG